MAAAMGRRKPAFRLVPPRASTAGPEVVALMRTVGVEFDPWQEDVLRDALGRDRAGRWAADTACLLCPRQNGKTVILLGACLWAAVGGRLVVFSAHQFRTARESFLQLKSWSEHPALEEFGPVVRTGAGNESVAFASGGRCVFVARSRQSGRGFSPDLVVADEAFELDDLQLDAVMPSLAAADRPLLWLASSAPHPTSSVLRRVALVGRAGADPRLCFREWCAAPDCDLDDVREWGRANPALGRRLTVEFTAAERNALSNEGFGRERLGVWSEDETPTVFPRSLWDALAAPSARPPTDARTALGVDVSPDRRRASIAAAADLGDGRVLVEVLEAREGVSWVVDEVAALDAEHRPGEILLDGGSQAASLLPALDKSGVKAKLIDTPGMVAACGGFYDLVVERRLAHVRQAALDAAVENAKQRQLGDRWAWSRRNSTADISALVAATLAAHGVTAFAKRNLEPLVAFV